MAPSVEQRSEKHDTHSKAIVCDAPKDNGCPNESQPKNFQNRWYYNSEKNACMAFKFTGCGGNTNNFKSRKDCEFRCKPRKTTLKPAALEVFSK